VGCGDKATNLYNTPHTTKLFRQIVEDYLDLRESQENLFRRTRERA